MKPTSHFLTRAALCAALVVPTACKSTSGAEGAQDLVTIAERLSAGVEQLDESISRMAGEADAIRNSVTTEADDSGVPVATQDLTVVYGSFMAGVEALLVNLETVEEDTEALEKSFKRYLKSVKRDNEQYTNPVLQQRGAARESKLEQDFTQLQGELAAFLERSAAYQTDVEEVSTYLGTALTPMSILDVEDVLENAVQKGAKLRAEVDEVTGAIATYTQTIRATGPSNGGN